MTTFYFVRHGKTEFNLVKRFQGMEDSPLLPQSLKDATKVGEFLSDVNFEAAYSSPQQRAVTTAEYILAENKHPVKLETVYDLHEIAFGERDGMLVENYQDDEQMLNFYQHPDLYDPSCFGGESFYQVIERTQKALAEIQARHPQGNVLIVAHAVVITFVVKSLLGIDVQDIQKEGLVTNTSVTKLSTSDFQAFSSDLWNETSFLK